MEKYKYDKNGVEIHDGDVLRYDNGKIHIAKIPQDYFWMRPRSEWRHRGGGLTILSNKKQLTHSAPQGYK